MRFVDILLVSGMGIVNPRGSLSEIKQTYLDFWSIVGTISVRISAADSRSKTYTADLAGALTLGGRLSCPGSAAKLVLVGSAATLSQCDAVDYTHQVGTVFPFEPRLSFLAEITGLPNGDFVPIDVSGYLRLLCFLSHRDSCYTSSLVDYVGDNPNAASRIKFRTPRNRLAQFSTR